MAQATSSPILQLIRRAVEDRRVRELADRELLLRFAARQDEAAFQALLHRHGAMVLDVCRGVLGNEADAEDAFQATFLVLARKAGSVRKSASIGCWLHGVAYRTAQKARAQAAARVKHNAHAPARRAAEADDLSWAEVRQALHAEMNRLGERYRAPLVLCYLEGKTQEQAARELGVAKSTLRLRVERGRNLLRSRLVGRGLGPAALLVAAAWPAAHASATASASVMMSTVKSACAFAAGKAAASPKIAALAAGVLNSMRICQLKMAASVLAAALLVCAAGLACYSSSAAEQTEPGRKADALPRKDKPADVKPEIAERQPVVVRGDAQIHQVAWNPDGKSLATIERTLELVYFKDDAGNDTGTGAIFPSSTVNLRDAKTGKVLRVLAEEKHTNIMALAVAPDGKTLAYSVARQHQEPSQGKSEVRLVDAHTGALKHKIDLLDSSGASALAFSPDGTRLAIGGGCLLLKHRTFLKLWDVKSHKLIGGTKDELKAENEPLPEKGQIFCLAFSGDSRWLAAGDQDGTIRVFDGATGDLTRVIEAHREWLKGLGFGPHGKTLVSAGADKTVKVWDAETGKLQEASADNDGTSFALPSDGLLLATAGVMRKDDKPMVEIILWHAKTDIPGVPLVYRAKQPYHYEPAPPDFSVTSIAFSRDRSTLAVGLSNKITLGARTQEIKVSGELRFWRVDQAAADPIEDGRTLLRRLGRLPADFVKAKWSDDEIIIGLFDAALGRAPTEAERTATAKRLQGAKNRTAASRDILWALVNSREFLQRRRLDADPAAALRLLNEFAAEWDKEAPRKP